MYLLFKFSAWLAQVAKYLLLITLAVVAMGFVTPDLGGEGKASALLSGMKAIDQPIMDVIRDYFPSTYKQKDISRYVALGLGLLMVLLLGSLINELFHRSALHRAKAQADQLHKFLKGSNPKRQGGNRSAQLLAKKVEQLEDAKGGDRSTVLREFINLKKQLEAMTRELAFLSIDVVDSTGMKVGEDTYVISNDFNEYRQFIEARIKANQCIKYTTTPDGLMAGFPDADCAVRAAQAIIRDLAEFNQNVKSMKRNFVVRCGVNSGKLFFDESLPLEQISDHVIDIAGHMQKYALPGTIFASTAVYQSLGSKSGFKDAETVVDDLNVYKWAL